MKVLPSSTKTVVGFKAVAGFFLILQLYGLGVLLFANGDPSPTAIKGFAHASLAIGVSYLFVYVRKYFPPGSQERASLLLIGFGIGLLALDELGKLNSIYDPVRIIAKIAASILFSIALISDPLKFLPVDDRTAIEPSKPSEIKRRGTWYWVFGFLFAFVIGFIPIINTQVLGEKDYPFEAWMQVVWFSGVISISFVISILCSERIWRWGIAVGLGLPAAFLAKISLDLFYSLPYQVNLYSLFTVLLSVVFFGLLPSFAGAASGFLIRRSLEVWRKTTSE